MKKYIAEINNTVISPSIEFIQDNYTSNPLKFINSVRLKITKDSLYLNSIILMISSGVQSFFGFLFWTLGSRTHSVYDIGIATTLISVSNLISSLSLLGLNSSIIRFLNKSPDKNKLLNTCFLIVGLMSFCIGLLFIILIHIISPKLAFLQRNLYFDLFFIVFTVIAAINTLSDSVFIAYRNTKYILYYDTFLNIPKILSLLLLNFTLLSVFFSYTLGVIAAFILTFYYLYRFFDYKFSHSIDKALIVKTSKFSLYNYLAGFIGSLPTLILPIIITNILGVKQSAYFYFALMIANFIYFIPMSITKSLFAEGSHSEHNIKIHLRKSILTITLILTPLLIGFFFFGNLILELFGKQYSIESQTILKLLVLTSIPVGLNYIIGTILNLYNKTSFILLINSINTTLIITFTLIFVKDGLVGIGYSWILGYLLSGLISVFIIRRLKI